MKKIKETIRAIWKDNVGSQLIATAILFLLTSIGTFLYFYFQQIKNSISFHDTYLSVTNLLNETQTIQNKYLLYYLILIILLLINRKIFISIFKIIFYSFFYRKDYHLDEYNFTNTGINKTYVFTTSRGYHNFKIKPINDTLNWGIGIVFSFSSDNLRKNDLRNCFRIEICKSHSKTFLELNSYDLNGIRIVDESKIIIDEYLNQELTLKFIPNTEKGGCELKIEKQEQTIYNSGVKFGVIWAQISALPNQFDFDLKIVEEGQI